jgi:hypothetical protein
LLDHRSRARTHVEHRSRRQGSTFNDALPLIRYELTDEVTRLDGTCPELLDGEAVTRRV